MFALCGSHQSLSADEWFSAQSGNVKMTVIFYFSTYFWVTDSTINPFRSSVCAFSSVDRDEWHEYLSMNCPFLFCEVKPLQLSFLIYLMATWEEISQKSTSISWFYFQSNSTVWQFFAGKFRRKSEKEKYAFPQFVDKVRNEIYNYLHRDVKVS